MFFKYFIVFLFLIINVQIGNFFALNHGQAPIDTLLTTLFNKVNTYQVLKEQNYTPPFKWAEKLGLYRSDIRINLAGNPFAQEVRSGQVAKVFDNDMFSSGWIITVLLEASLYGKGAPQLDENRLRLAIEGE